MIPEIHNKLEFTPEAIDLITRLHREIAGIAQQTLRPDVISSSSSDIAQEVCHDLMVALSTGRITYRNDASFLALVRIRVRHRFLDRLRQHREKREFVSELDSPTDEKESKPVASASRREMLARQNGRATALPQPVVNLLSPQELLVLELRVYEAASFKEIAEQLGIRDGAARQLARRAIAKVEAAFRDCPEKLFAETSARSPKD